MMLAFDPATGKTTTLYAGSSQDRYKESRPRHDGDGPERPYASSN